MIIARTKNKILILLFIAILLIGFLNMENEKIFVNHNTGEPDFYIKCFNMDSNLNINLEVKRYTDTAKSSNLPTSEIYTLVHKGKIIKHKPIIAADFFVIYTYSNGLVNKFEIENLFSHFNGDKNRINEIHIISDNNFLRLNYFTLKSHQQLDRKYTILINIPINDFIYQQYPNKNEENKRKELMEKFVNYYR